MSRIFLALAVLFAASSAALADIPPLRPSQGFTWTVVTIPANTSTFLVPANPTRKSLQILQIGTGFATVRSFPGAGTGGTVPSAPGQASATSNAVTIGQGYPLESASAAGHQGGSTVVYDGALTNTDEWDGISAAGTTLLVIEGN